MAGSRSKWRQQKMMAGGKKNCQHKTTNIWHLISCHFFKKWPSPSLTWKPKNDGFQKRNLQTSRVPFFWWTMLNFRRVSKQVLNKPRFPRAKGPTYFSNSSAGFLHVFKAQSFLGSRWVGVCLVTLPETNIWVVPNISRLKTALLSRWFFDVSPGGRC